MSGFLVISLWVVFVYLSNLVFGSTGVIGDSLATFSGGWWKYLLYTVAMVHLTITAMSLSFHRHHTHHGIKINPVLDSLMQIWLWFTTSMSKLDWVSVHLFHHAHSDKEKDPHSPVHKGLLHVFFLGAFDYNKAKNWPEVLRIRRSLKVNKLEIFLAKHQTLGPMLMIFTFTILLGPFNGTLCAVTALLVSPIFAVGGVNALAHWVGYKNHKSGDNSRNVGFLFPLNFLICGELDHNNHHKFPRSCSFRHRWYEFDIGYFYIKILNWFKLVEIKNVYTTRHFKEVIGQKMKEMMATDYQLFEKAKKLADEFNMSIEELQATFAQRIEGKKVEWNAKMDEYFVEIRKVTILKYRLGYI